MFESLRETRWNEYRTFFGKPEDLPDLLIQTQAGSRVLQRAAWTGLNYAVSREGSSSSSALAVLPFLAEILQTSSSFGKQEAANLLAWVALSLPLSSNMPVTEQKVAPNQQQELRRDQERLLLRKQLRNALQPFVPLLYPYIRDPDGDGIVIQALIRFPEYTDTSIAALDEAMRTERDEQMRLLMQLAAAYLAGAEIKPEYRDLLGLFD